MNESVIYQLNKASAADIAKHLSICDADFVPPLSARMSIGNYAQKIVHSATRFEAWIDGSLVGLVAAYCNDMVRHVAYITNVSLRAPWHGKGIASELARRCIEYTKAIGFTRIELEVDKRNVAAVKLYENQGFQIDTEGGTAAHMYLDLCKDN